MTFMRTVLDFVFPPQCGGCEKIGSGVCEACLPPAAPFERRLRSFSVSALGTYDGTLRRAILALKSGRRDVAEAFAERLARNALDGDELVVPVPTTAARRRQRGFDGCELIARLAFGSRVVAGLSQVRGETQRGRGREARLEKRQRFIWRGGPLSGGRIVLLDDVVTTGATLETCAAILRAAGGEPIRARAIAVVL